MQQGLLLHQLIASTGSHLSGHFYKPSKNFLPACSLVTFTPKVYKEHLEKDSKQEMENFVQMKLPAQVQCSEPETNLVVETRNKLDGNTPVTRQ